jgi:hypothetical protein
MTTTDNVLLVISTSILSLYFLLSCVAIVFFIRLLNNVRRVVKRAETVVDSVEAAADVFKDASGRLAVFKLLKNIVELVQHKQ